MLLNTWWLYGAELLQITSIKLPVGQTGEKLNWCGLELFQKPCNGITCNKAVTVNFEVTNVPPNWHILTKSSHQLLKLQEHRFKFTINTFFKKTNKVQDRLSYVYKNNFFSFNKTKWMGQI